MSHLNQDDPKLPAPTPGLLPAPLEPLIHPRPHEGAPEVGEGWAVVLFEGGQHSADEVALQIVLATGCCWQIAADITLRAQKKGSAIVTISARSEAERVAHVLRRIALIVAVEQI